MGDLTRPRRTLPPLPRAIVVTAVVTLLPIAAVWQLRATGAVSRVTAMVLAALLSLAFFHLSRLHWQRQRSSKDILFSELMLWGWVRQRRLERRLTEAMARLGLDAQDARWSPLCLSPEHRMELLRRLAYDREASDPYTHWHSRRVARYAVLMGRKMGLGRRELDQVRTAALLHDLGKLYTPKDILHKPGSLTDEEFDLVKRHTVDGARMIRLLLGDEELASIVLHHHERFAGDGYPCSLNGDLIPLPARIIAVADTFDAIVSERSYRAARSHKAGLDALRQGAGTQFDPAAVSAFFEVYDGRRWLGAFAGLSAAAEGLIPNLPGAGAILGGIAAGAALGGGSVAPTAEQHRARTDAAVLTARPLSSAAPASPRRGHTVHWATGRSTTGSLRSRSHSPRPRAGGGRLPPAGTPTAPRPGGGGTAPGGDKPSTSGGGTAPGGGKPPPSGGGTAPPSGGPAGPGGGVTVTTNGTGVGATVNQAGATATVGANANPSNPGVTVGLGAGGSSTGLSASGAGGVSAGGSVTPPGLP